MRFETAILTEPGDRPVNQDVAAHAGSCWTLADGLGGHGGGEHAARIAVEAVMSASTAAAPGLDPRALILAANDAVMAAQHDNPGLAQMRTTLVVLVAGAGGEATWAHVGDSRLYHFRGARVMDQTVDHSFAQTLVDAGRIAPSAIRFHEDRSRLLRTAGTPDCDPTVSAPVTLQPGDAFLLATDGFWEAVLEREMEIEYARSETASQWLNQLRTCAYAKPLPDRDNLSAIGIFIHAT